MLKISKTLDDRLLELSQDNIESGAWISLIKPTAEELIITERLTEAPQDFVRSALDPEESSRIEIEDNHILVLINVPVNHEDRPGEYDTIPLGIIVTPDFRDDLPGTQRYPSKFYRDPVQIFQHL